MSKEDDFCDPLGAMGKSESLEDISEPSESSMQTASEDHLNKSDRRQIEPIKSADLDAIIAESNARIQSHMKIRQLTPIHDDSELNDLFITVDSPEKHVTTMESYITFRITSKTTRKEMHAKEFEVRRRYNDFLWLRQKMEESQPAYLIPPLPEKHPLRQLERFSPEFVKLRQVGLQAFLQRLAEHPVLSFNQYFLLFITAKQSKFQDAKKQNAGIISRLADSLHSMGASYMVKNRPPEYTLMNEYINVFAEKLISIERIAQRIIREQNMLLEDLNEWGPEFTLWAGCETELSASVTATAQAIQKCYLSLQTMIDASEDEMLNPLREYMRYTESVKAVLRRRDGIQMEYGMTHEELNKKKDEQEQKQIEEAGPAEHGYFSSFFSKDPETNRKESEKQINKLSQQCEILRDNLECANADLKADMERWHKQKRKDFRKMFMDVADRQIVYYTQCMKSWQDAIPQMKLITMENGDVQKS